MTLAGPEPKSGQTLADGCITWTVTQPGVYTVTEEDQAGWTPQGAVRADFTVVSGGGPSQPHLRQPADLLSGCH